MAKRKNCKVCGTDIALCYDKALTAMRLSLNGNTVKAYPCDSYTLVTMPFDIQSQRIKEVTKRLRFKMH